MRWLKVREVAEHAQVHEKTVYEAIRRGDLKVARIGAGRNVRIADSWADEWLEQNATQLERHNRRTPRAVA